MKPHRNRPRDGAQLSAGPSTQAPAPHSGAFAYVPGLDGLRAVAVAGVLLYHAQVGWLPGGFLGVDVFFVLSGYLITSLLLIEHRGTGRIALGRFWAARARRLLPAALLVIAASLVIGAAFLRGDLHRLRGDALASALYVNNWRQVVTNASYFAHFGRPSLLAHYWSLSVEEQFYLVWPVLLGGLLFLGRQRVAAAAALAAAASVALMTLSYHPGSDPSRVYYGTDTRAAPLMIGAALAFVWPLGRMTAGPGRGARTVLDAVGLAGLGGLIVAMYAWHDYEPFIYRGGLLLTAVAAGAVILAVTHPGTRLGGALAIQPLRWLGQRSYGIYLYHWPVIALSRPGLDIHAAAATVVPGQIAVTVVLAALSYRYVEMPVRRRRSEATLAAWMRRHRPGKRYGAALAASLITGAVVFAAAIVPAAGSHLPMASLATRAATVTPAPPSTRRPALLVIPAAAARSRAPRGAAHGPVLAIGASVMLDSAPALERQLGARVDAAVGRQPATIIDRLATYRGAGALPPNVVVQIGDNGPLWGSDQARLRRVLRGVTRVVLVNIRQTTSWEGQVNRALVELARTWPQATVADWHAASADQNLLWDGAHPKPTGQVIFARTVAAALGRVPRAVLAGVRSP